MSSADLSVIISTHARPVEVREAVSAIGAQDHPGPIETIVVFDKAEPDMSLESDDALRPVRVIPNHHGNGLPGSRNAGAEVAEADVLGFCDDDDLWKPTKASAQLALIEAGALASTTGIEIHSRGETLPRPGDTDSLTLADLLRSRRVEANMVTAMVRKDAFWGEIGPMDEAIPGGFAEDYDWVIRAAKVAPIAVVAEPQVIVRWATESHFRQNWANIDSALGYLLAKHPEFDSDRRGKARVEGQRAFARAADHRSGTWGQILRTLTTFPLEPRWFLAALVAAHLAKPEVVLERLNKRGRGI